MLAVQRVHSSQPHQAHEQGDRPQDLHKETQLVEERFSYSRPEPQSMIWALREEFWENSSHFFISFLKSLGFTCAFASVGTGKNVLLSGI